MLRKATVDEMLDTYLDEIGVEEQTRKKIVRGLHATVTKEETIKKKREVKEEKKEKERERKRQKRESKSSSISHGTSCPRIMNKIGELALEF